MMKARTRSATLRLESMTTVTETAERVGGAFEPPDLRRAATGEICRDPLLVERIAGRMIELADAIVPGRSWSMEEARDILAAALRARQDHGVRIEEGRYFRKRLRELCALARDCGDPFAVAVVTLREDSDEGDRQSVLDAVVERLRRPDMVFVYRRRFALLLPGMRAAQLSALFARARDLVRVGAGEQTLEEIDTLACPDPAFPETSDILDWAEDRLRNAP
jgi:hypothetical protein